MEDCYKVWHSLTLLLSWSHTQVLSGLFYLSLATVSHCNAQVISSVGVMHVTCCLSAVSTWVGGAYEIRNIPCRSRINIPV